MPGDHVKVSGQKASLRGEGTLAEGPLQEKPTFLFQGKAWWPLSPLGLAAPKALTSALSHVGGTLICHETLWVFPKNRKRAFTVALLASWETACRQRAVFKVLKMSVISSVV